MTNGRKLIEIDCVIKEEMLGSAQLLEVINLKRTESLKDKGEGGRAGGRFTSPLW